MLPAMSRFSTKTNSNNNNTAVYDQPRYTHIHTHARARTRTDCNANFLLTAHCTHGTGVVLLPPANSRRTHTYLYHTQPV